MSVYRVSSNKSSVNNFPTVRPTLDLDFANSKTLDPRITFTRASGGSYVGADGLIKLAGVNEARFDHDPYTGESLGLLIEESRTNLLSASEEMTISPWGLAAATGVANNGIAPDGTTTADKIISTGGGCFRTGVGVDNATAYTYSVFLKYVAGTGVLGQIGFLSFGSTLLAGNSSFNLLTGTVVSNGASVQTSSITRYPNNWYRVSVTATSTDVTATVINYAGVQGGEFFIWGAQLEKGAFPTSYIPTVASTRTRAADSASITGKNFRDFYRPDEGTVFADFANKNPLIDAVPVTINDGTNNNRIGFDVTTTGFGRIVVDTAGVSQVLAGTGGLTAGGNTKIAGLYKVNDFGVSKNGGAISSDTGGTVPTTTQLEIGYRLSTLSLNGTISRLTYYPKRLPNAQLQALTK